MSEEEVDNGSKIEDKTESISESEVPVKVYALYKRRYFILVVLALGMFSNGEAWMTIGSVTPNAMIYYNQTEQNINWFGNVFLLAYAVEAIPCSFFPQILGLKWCILIGCILNSAGLLCRLVSFSVPGISINFKFGIAMLGNAILGLAQGFLLNMPSLMSARWFGDKERSISTSVCYMLSIFGIGVGYLAIFLAVGNRTQPHDVEKSFLYVAIPEFILSALVLVIGFISCRDAPPTPPSQSEETVLELNRNEAYDMKKKIRDTLKETFGLFIQPQAFGLIFVFSVYYACSTTLFIFLSSIVFDFVTNINRLTGYIGSFGVFFGGALTFLFSYVLEKTHNKYNRKFGMIIQVLCLIPALIIAIIAGFDKHNNVSMFILCVFYFSFSTPYNPVGLELLADVTYPLDPNISSNAALIAANILSVIMTYLLGLITGREKYYASIGICVTLYLINTVILAAMKFTRKRNDPSA